LPWIQLITEGSGDYNGKAAQECNGNAIDALLIVIHILSNA